MQEACTVKFTETPSIRTVQKTSFVEAELEQNGGLATRSLAS